MQSQYPLRDLPAMRDLYTQALNPQVSIERFGAALFRTSVATASRGAQLDIPVGPDYVIGPGDQLVVEYWGRTTQHLQLTVDREGRVLLPEAGGVIVAGRTLADAQQVIQRMLSRQFRDITVDVSLGKLRTVRVYVVGDVKNPGAYDISSLSTALSALIVAGGPTDAGSYRTVNHYRGRKLLEEVDLYELMLKGVTSGEIHLESGDSIQVPTAGPQVTVEGSVRRPAIYELRNEKTLDQVLDLAGGIPVTGELDNVKVERIAAHERKEMLNINLPQSGDDTVRQAFKRVEIRDGDTITVSPILPYTSQAVYVQGHVFRPGKFPYKEGLKVTDLIGSFNDLLPEPADRAEIIRLHPPDYNPAVIAFNIRDVLEKHAAAPVLEPFDTIRVYGRYEADAPKVSIFGQVLRPGEYPLSEGMTTAQLVRLAGGFTRSAFRDQADLSSYQVVNGEKVELDHRQVPIGRALNGEPDTDVLLKPGDVLTISQIGGWEDIGGAVGISGQVLHPGRYGLQNGERLSSVLRRAGGFSPEAYPYGAILERAAVREFSARTRDDLIARLQGGNTAPRTGRPASLAPTSAAASASSQNQQLAERLKQIQPSGRMVIHISGDISKWEKTAANIELRPGDTLFIPKRPNFVMVAGQVYSPLAITYSKGKSAGWYLNQAGGPTTLADKKNIFVIRADGSVIGRGSHSWWSGSVMGAVLQPGDTIYVPDKVSGGNAFFRNIGQTVQLLSGAAVAVSVIRTF
jgi:protein involved in polysaccharide export with SLBB domain